MPRFAVAEAAKRAGVERTTLYRKLQRGEISAVPDGSGAKLIDASELIRVYPTADVITPLDSIAASTHDEAIDGVDVETPSIPLRLELKMREQRIEELERQIAQLRHDKDDVISDLRQRLDTESEERRKLTLMITDQRSAADKAADEKARALEELAREKSRGFFSRLFGR